MHHQLSVHEEGIHKLRLRGGIVVGPIFFVIACLIAQASIVSCQKRQAYQVPKGFVPYLIQDDHNRMFLVCLPERFAVTRSKHRDEYRFDSKDGATIVVSASSGAPSGLLEMIKSDQSSKDLAGKIELRAGALAYYKLLTCKGAGTPPTEAIGTWTRYPAVLLFHWKGFVDNYSEIKDTLRCIDFDEHIQSAASAREYAGQPVIQLDRSSTGI